MLSSSITLNTLKQELHRPLRTMLGLAVLLDKEIPVSNQKLYLQDLRQYAQSILNFVTQWLDSVQEINFTRDNHYEVNETSFNPQSFKILLVEDTEIFQEINFTRDNHYEVNETSFNPQSFKILLVEDTEIIQIVHKRMLENLGYQVELADCAEMALYMINKTTYDVILMDISLPGMNGIDAAIEIRLKYQDLPIIALTAFSDRTNFLDCKNAGINDFVTKPISQEKLKKLMDYYTKIKK